MNKIQIPEDIRTKIEAEANEKVPHWATDDERSEHREVFIEWAEYGYRLALSQPQSGEEVIHEDEDYLRRRQEGEAYKSIQQENEKITGFKTPAEFHAYQKGQDDYDITVVKFVNDWKGETNSSLGQALHDKFNSVQQENERLEEELEDTTELFVEAENNAHEFEVKFGKAEAELSSLKEQGDGWRDQEIIGLEFDEWVSLIFRKVGNHSKFYVRKSDISENTPIYSLPYLFVMFLKERALPQPPKS